MKETDNFEKRVFLFLPAIPAIFVGIFADRFIFRWEDYNFYCTAVLTVLTVLVVPSLVWIWDIIGEIRLWLAIKKELNDMFRLMPVGTVPKKRLNITVD